jgi:hypothetical protein
MQVEKREASATAPMVRLMGSTGTGMASSGVKRGELDPGRLEDLKRHNARVLAENRGINYR